MPISQTNKTYSPKASEITHAWRLIDADGQTLGRLASAVAGFLRGKHRPIFAEHLDVGDYVVVINASRIRVSGNKARDRLYYRHSNYPGGLKSVSLGEVLERHPDRLIKQTVKGMLPHNVLGRKMLRKLKVYGGSTHPHEAQFKASEKQQKAEEQSA